MKESSRQTCAWVGLCVLFVTTGLACGDDAAGGAGATDAGPLHAGGPTGDAAQPTDARITQPTPDASSPRSDAGSAQADGGAHDAGDVRRDAGAGNGAKASWLIQSGDSVFFVGNSFFSWQDRVLPDWVASIGQTVSPKITIKTGAHIVPGENPLSWFFDQSASKDAIASRKYKLFILQGEETEPVDDKEAFHGAVRDYHAAITASGASVMLFMTWDFLWNKDNPAFFQKLSAAYEEIGKELDIPVIPVGLIWDDANKAPFPGEKPYFLNGQDLHQTEKGSAANAYATFAMLTGVNPMGIEFKANGQTNSPELLKYLSDKAWIRVSARLHD